MSIRLILMSKEGQARQQYEEALRRQQVEFDTVGTLAELTDMLKQKAYNGILIDVLSKVKESSEEQTRVHHILDMYPLARLKWNAKKQQVNALIYEKCDDDDVLSFFINQQCRIFKPKQLRSASRLNINFNVMLSREKFMHRNNVERAVTIDISSGGCFIYADSNWCGVKEVWFVIKEIGDHTPILGEIKRYQPWGTKMGYPGLGVLFTQITDMQKQQLSRWLGA